ncbi:MAG: hypothetical protein CVV61_04850 [Tenericutes bacterium HGW-Tenericutes-6]|nr:MAG: hypothetical protein CVV61_04850 [Tenericutes bacterium HGW-Tenericutes-6]
MFNTRRKNYFNRIEPLSLTLIFSGHAPQKSADQFYPFAINRNFYYLTGIEQQNTVLLLAKGLEKEESYLFIEAIDPVKALWDGAGLTFEEASNIAEIDLKNVKNIDTLDTFISELMSTSRRALFGQIKKVYFDLEHPKDHTTPGLAYSHKLLKAYPFAQIETNQMILAELRTVKDSLEIEHVKKAIEITKEGLNQIMSTLKPGTYEYQVEASYNYVLNLHRTSPSFQTIAASGKNATILHYVENKDEIKDGDLVLFDLGVDYKRYASDITRTYPANGKFTDRQRQVYEIVLEANKKTIEWLKPGVTLAEFNDFGKQILIKGLKKLGLIEKDEDIIKYYYHSLGHYLGLDVHDGGNYSLPIPEGALITVEPGLYIAEWGIGIRIEDDVFVTKDGAINLSASIIKEIDEIEAYMKK